MKIKPLLLATSLVAITFTSCQKQPEATFATDKSEYVAGETVKLSNTSADANSYKWTMPDGQIAKSIDVTYKIDEKQKDGTLTFKLEAFSKNAKKDDETTKTVKIKVAKGNAVFWQRTGSGFDVTVVELNGITSNITVDSPSTPECGSAGNAVFNGLEVGTYNWTATDGTYNWNGTINITRDGCTKQELGY